MSSNGNEMKTDRETLLKEIKKCKRQSFLVALLSMLCGVACFVMGFWMSGNYGHNYYELLTYGFLGLALLFMFFGAVMAFRGTYFMILPKDANVIDNKVCKINSGTDKHPSKTQKKWYLYAGVIAAVLLTVYSVLFILGTNSHRPDNKVEWEMCLKCGGDGKVVNDLGYNVTCSRCSGVGYIP